MKLVSVSYSLTSGSVTSATFLNTAGSYNKEVSVYPPEILSFRTSDGKEPTQREVTEVIKLYKNLNDVLTAGK